MSIGGKATFVGIEGSSAFFQVQYNPREFTVQKSVTWEEAQEQGQSTNQIQFQKGAPMTASFELMFDTSNLPTPLNVQLVWVGPLLQLTEATEEAVGGEQKNLGKKRPPILCFTWGTFVMKCVIESVDTTYLMFAPTGEAIRAKCQVKLKEWKGANEEASAASAFIGTAINVVATIAGLGSNSGRVVLVKGGETLSQVAAAHGTDARTLAVINGIVDPLADLTGMALAVPF